MKASLVWTLLFMFSTAQAEIQFTWLGTTGTYLSDGKTALLIDPVVTRPNLYDEIFNREIETDRNAVRATIQKLQLTQVQAVFVSHSHFDHAMDAPEFVKQTSSKLYGSSSTANIGRGDHLSESQIHTFRANEVIQIGAFKITVLDSTHPPLICAYQTAPGNIDTPLSQPTQIRNFKMGGAYSFLIEHPDGRLFFHPTSRTHPGEIIPQADVLFLGIASRDSEKDILDSLVKPTAPGLVIPLHFDDFFSPVAQDGESTKILIGVDLKSFLKRLKQYYPITKSLVPYYGKPERIL